jgi:Uma2 family endonuclease
MSIAEHRPKPMTAAEFLALPEDGTHAELVNGVVYNMTGAGGRHNTVAVNAVGALLQRCRELACRIYTSSMLLRIDDSTVYAPDVMVTCVPSESDRFETSPCLIIEVLSPTTANIDDREKRIAYARIPTMRDYLIVDHEATRVEHFHRESADTWSWTTVERDGLISTACVGDIAVADLFIGL